MTLELIRLETIAESREPRACGVIRRRSVGMGIEMYVQLRSLSILRRPRKAEPFTDRGRFAPF
jgi:hypothetical protein